MPPRYQLIAVAGPMKGEAFALLPDRRTKIGRGARGIILSLDEHASIEHAEVTFETDRYWIHDLDSVSGTFVNGQRIGKHGAEILPGTVIEIGSTVFRVDDPRALSRYLGWMVAVLGPIAAAAVVLAYFAIQPVTYGPALVWSGPVRQRVRTSNVIPVSLDFVRAVGLDHRHMAIRRVTDYDEDGVDELWLRTTRDDMVVTFGERGEWVLLVSVPRGCIEKQSVSFPDLHCNGVVHEWDGERYGVQRLDSAVAWMRQSEVRSPGPGQLPDPRAASREPGVLQPFRVTFTHPDRLKGALRERGVEEPIHYLICEEAIPGVKPQVLLADGRLQTLRYGCLGRVDVVLAGWAHEFPNEPPAAIAFTAVGYRALVEDVNVYLSGDPTGLFLTAADHALADPVARPPKNRTGIRVSFHGESTPGDVIAAEGPLTGLRVLERSDLARPEPPIATSTVILSGSHATLDPPGCSELDVSLRAWHCKLLRWCLPSRGFIAVSQVGCGRDEVLLKVPYSGGRVVGGDDDVDVVVEVDAKGGVGQVDVLRARVAWRERKPGAPATP